MYVIFREHGVSDAIAYYELPFDRRIVINAMLDRWVEETAEAKEEN